MTVALTINQVFMAEDGAGAPFEGVARLIAIADDQSVASLIRLDQKRLTQPFLLPVAALQGAIADETVVRLDAFETNLPDSRRRLKERARSKLERMTALMSPLIGDPDLALDSDYRKGVLRRRAKETGVCTRTIRRHYYAYLSGGQTEVALADRIHRVPAAQAKGTAKRGRKPVDGKNYSNLALPEVRADLEKAARKYYLSGKHSLFDSFTLALEDHWSTKKRARSDHDGKVTVTVTLLPAKRRPSYHQFRYLCRTLEALKGRRTTLPRRARSRLPKRALPGNARAGVRGPGYRFEIDASRLQIQLTSKFGRHRRVSEATLYVIIDVWSGAYVGYVLSLEDPSWALAARALFNCFTDKGEVFERLNLPYSSKDWPACHLPARLAADRAELISNKANVVPEIHIKVEIMPPMCPERKGKVEAGIKDLKHGHSYYKTPGSHAKTPRRREENGKGRAALTLAELEALVVERILDLNNEPVPIEQLPPEVLSSGRESVTHIGLFKWGLEHRPGSVRTVDRKVAFTSLLPRGTGTITARGLRFKGQTYVSKRLVDAGLLARAAQNGAYEVDVCHDEYADQIWFFDEELADWQLAENDNEEIRRFQALFRDVEEVRAKAKELAVEAKTANVLRKSAKRGRINRAVNEAIADAKRSNAGQPKRASNATMRSNKAVDREAERIRYAEEAQSIASAIAHVRRTPTSSPDTEHTQSLTERSKTLWRRST